MLGAKARYMKKMLELVKQKVENKVIDITLKFTLSALWNLTGQYLQIYKLQCKSFAANMMTLTC